MSRRSAATLFRVGHAAIGLAIATMVTLILTSCPPPFTQEIVETVEDRIEPAIDILSPTNDEEYQATVTVTGTITDSSVSDGDGRGTITGINFEIANTSVSAQWTSDGSGDTILYDPVSGVFEVTVDTADLTSRSITLSITAEDRNLNSATRTISMVRTDGPAFADFEIFDPPGATSFTANGPLGIRGSVTNSSTDTDSGDNITSLSWRRGSWSGTIDFTADPDVDGWYEVENVGTGGTGNRGNFRFNVNDGTVEITIPDVNADPTDMLELILEAQDSNGNENSSIYRVFGLDAPGAGAVTPASGLYFSSIAGSPSAFDVQVEAFSTSDKDRIDTITYWFNSDTANIVTDSDVTGDWQYITLPGNSDPSWVYTISVDPAGNTADQNLFNGDYSAGSPVVTMNIELLDDELPGSPQSTSLTIADDKDAPAISGVTIVSGSGLPSYARDGNLVTLQFTLSDSLSGVSGTPTVEILGNVVSPSLVSGDANSGVWQATHTILSGDSATAYGGEPLAAFTIDADDAVGNPADRYDHTDLDTDGTNLRFYDGLPAITGISVAGAAPSTTWAIDGETVTIDFSITDDRDPASGYPTVTLWPGTGDSRTAAVTDNGSDYTATIDMNAADPEGAIPYLIAFTDAADNAGSTGTVTSGVKLDLTLPPQEVVPASVAVQGGTLAAGYWNSTNSSILVTTTIPAEAFDVSEFVTLVGGSLQIQAGIDGGSFEDIGTADVIESGEIGFDIPITLLAADLEGITGYYQGADLSFRAIVTDAAGNMRIGSANGTTFEVDTTLPGDPTVAITPTTVNIADNATGTLATISGDIGSSYAITLTNAVRTSDSAAGPFTGTIDGSGSTSITVSASATGTATVTATLTDAAGNPAAGSGSDSFYAALTPPASPVVDSVSVTGGTVVTGATDYWNSSNTGIDVSVPIPNNASLDTGSEHGSVQIQAKGGAASYANVGNAHTIDLSGGAYSASISLNELQVEGIAGYAQATSLFFRAVITDVAGNSTTGSAGADTIEVDTTAPSDPTVAITPTTVNIADNATGTLATISGDIGSSYAITLTNAVRTSDSAAGPFTGTIDGSGSTSITVSASATGTATVTATLTDAAGNPAAGSGSDSFYAALTPPASPVVDSVSVTGGTVVTGATAYWNSSNTGIDIAVPIPNDSPLDGGSVQIRARGGAAGYADVGSAHTIDLSGGAYSASISLNKVQVEGIAGYAQGATLSFLAVITDQYGNSTSGSAGADTIEVDTTAPNDPTVAITPTTVNIADNTTGTLATISGDIGGSYAITLTNAVRTSDSAAGPFTGTIDGSGSTSITVSASATGTATVTATLTDAAGNPAAGSGSDSFYAALTPPASPVVDSVSVTGGTVVTGATDYWNSSNTGIDIAVPIPNDSPLDGGSVQIRARGGAAGYADVGSAHTIDLSGGAYSASISLNKVQVEGIAGYAQGATLSFLAVITDQYGNSTSGSAGADTIAVDTEITGATSIGYTDAGNGTVVTDDTIDWTTSTDEESGGLAYYIFLAKRDSTDTTDSTIESVYYDTSTLNDDVGTGEFKVKRIDSANTSEGTATSVLFSNDVTYSSENLVNYAFADNVEVADGSPVAISVGDRVQVFVLTIDSAGNIDIAEHSGVDPVLASIIGSGSAPRTTPMGMTPLDGSGPDSSNSLFGNLWTSRASRRSRAPSPPAATDSRPTSTVVEDRSTIAPTGSAPQPPSEAATTYQTAPATTGGGVPGRGAPTGPVTGGDSRTEASTASATPQPSAVGATGTATFANAGGAEEASPPSLLDSDRRTLAVLLVVAAVAILGLAAAYLRRRPGGRRT